MASGLSSARRQRGSLGTDHENYIDFISPSLQHFADKKVKTRSAFAKFSALLIYNLIPAQRRAGFYASLHNTLSQAFSFPFLFYQHFLPLITHFHAIRAICVINSAYACGNPSPASRISMEFVAIYVIYSVYACGNPSPASRIPLTFKHLYVIFFCILPFELFKKSRIIGFYIE